MNKLNRWVMGFLLLVVFAAGMHLLDTYVFRTSEENMEDIIYSSYHTAPGFTVRDSDGEEVRLANFYPKPIMICFWASWDEASRNALPIFEELHQEYGERIQFVMVYVTDGNKETQETAEEYLKENEYSLPVFYDTDGSAIAAYETRSIPATFFINSNFELIARASGPVSHASLEEGLKMAVDPKTDN